jgi:hypothetical protein
MTSTGGAAWLLVTKHSQKLLQSVKYREHSIGLKAQT